MVFVSVFLSFFSPLDHGLDLEGSSVGNILCPFWPRGGCRGPAPSCTVRALGAKGRPKTHKWTRRGRGEEGGKGAAWSPTVGVGGRSLLEGAGKTGWTGQRGLGCPSLAKPGGERGCEYQLRSIETAPWAESPVL